MAEEAKSDDLLKREAAAKNNSQHNIIWLFFVNNFSIFNVFFTHLISVCLPACLSKLVFEVVLSLCFIWFSLLWSCLPSLHSSKPCSAFASVSPSQFTYTRQRTQASTEILLIGSCFPLLSLHPFRRQSTWLSIDENVPLLKLPACVHHVPRCMNRMPCGVGLGRATTLRGDPKR